MEQHARIFGRCHHSCLSELERIQRAAAFHLENWTWGELNMSLSSDASNVRKSVTTFDTQGRIVQKIECIDNWFVTIYDKNGTPVGGRESVAPKEDSDGESVE